MTGDELAGHLGQIAAAGELTPAAVVTAAADPEHPLHRYFDWDDTTAAEAWRRQQARMLIARVRVIIPKQTARGVRPINVRAFASVAHEHGRSYWHVDEIAADGEASEQVLAQIKADIAALQHKYRAYGDLFREALEAMFAAA